MVGRKNEDGTKICIKIYLYEEKRQEKNEKTYNKHFD